MASIKPLPNYVLVEPVEDETQTDGGLYVPETDKDKPSKGKVVACGEYMTTDTVKIPLYGAIRDAKTVIYKRFVNQDIQHEGKKYLLIHLNELLAVVE